MLNPIDSWFVQQDEPARSCLQFLREHILRTDPQISEAWRYSMPFYFYGTKRICYLWTSKKYNNQPYIGVVDGKDIDDPDLLAEKRSRMKILLLDPSKDLPIKKIDRILRKTILLHTNPG